MDDEWPMSDVRIMWCDALCYKCKNYRRFSGPSSTSPEVLRKRVFNAVARFFFLLTPAPEVLILQSASA